jgi:hypothetical protein
LWLKWVERFPHPTITGRAAPLPFIFQQHNFSTILQIYYKAYSLLGFFALY